MRTREFAAPTFANHTIDVTRRSVNLRRFLRHSMRISAAVIAISLVASTTVSATQTASSRRGAANTAPRHASVSAKSYATSLFARIPVPPSATPIAPPSKPLLAVTGSPIFSHVVHLTRYYVLPASFSVGRFAKSHFAASEWQGTGSSSDGGYRTSYSLAGLGLCRDRHATYCSVTYTTTAISNAQQELRIDVDVAWAAIHTVYLPTSGAVTLTGYERLSLMNASSGPVDVTLNASQVQRLRTAISRLRSSPGGMCMEDSTLYKISVAAKSGATVLWSAVADECPGTLTVTSKSARVALNDRSCALEHLVSTFFPAKEAQGTKAGLKVCTALA